MKKIVFHAIVTPNDDAVTVENLKDTIRQLGSAYFTFEAEFETASTDGLTKEAWVYVSADDSEPYIKVSGPGETEGEELSDDAADELRNVGVVIEFRAQYPRADRYGSPVYNNDEDFTKGVVGNHLFKVADEGFEVYAEDRGDDGSEQIWLKLALPA